VHDLVLDLATTQLSPARNLDRPMPRVKFEPVSKSSDSRLAAIVIGLDCITGLQIARVLLRHGARAPESRTTLNTSPRELDACPT
jgi:hypothetical protein